MLVFAGIVPHPPILIPTIGKENLTNLNKTIKALDEMEKLLYAAQVETIIIVSPHGLLLPKSFTLNLCSTAKAADSNTQFQGDFEDFGDFSTKFDFKNDPKLLSEIYTRLSEKLPLKIVDTEKLDHGTLVPLYYLTRHLPDIKILPLGYSFLDYSEHWQFGVLLSEVLSEMDKRVALIASGDLSHRLTKDAPAKYSPKGKIFDTKLKDLLKHKDFEGVLNLDQGLIEEAGECGLRSILILLGAIGKTEGGFDILSYEGPFGVGYLVANYNFA